MKNQRKKIAKITKVELIDNQGTVKNVFKTGERVSITIFFKIYRPKKIFHFGLAIFDAEGHYVFGVNTLYDQIDVNKYIKQKY